MRSKGEEGDLEYLSLDKGGVNGRRMKELELDKEENGSERVEKIGLSCTPI